MKLTDLHNHTTFSYDGKNSPEEIIKNAIKNNIDVLGICDHQYSLGSDLSEYIYTLKELKYKYKNLIDLKIGLEIGTRPGPSDFLLSFTKELDYCLFECLDSDFSIDFYEFLQWVSLFKIPVGLAHTDIFYLSEKYDEDILKIMKDYNIFWEINASGNYNYYYDFITNKEKQQIIKNSKIFVSIGSDTHLINDFKISKIKSLHSLIENLGNPIIFS